MDIKTLGEARFDSPVQNNVRDAVRVPLDLIRDPGVAASDVSFELAGPRAKLYFAPNQAKIGIVTCGGLCPGLNSVIRSLFLQARYIYGVEEVLGFRNGYQGLDPRAGQEPIPLTHERVEDIHRQGGTILGTSRGPVDVGAAVENLMRLGVNILFTVGGDGTQRGSNALFQEAVKRGYELSVVGVPKTIDNDVAFVSRSFGFLTAVSVASQVLACAHTEARSVENGISVVKLMGRHAGFIAVAATVANQDVNFTLIPEVPFALDGANGFLTALENRVCDRGHALVVAAEGAGQDLLAGDGQRDASGNIRLQDIGPFLKEKITEHFKSKRVPMTIRYIDPSYAIRSVPAGPFDSILCDQFARHAVHAAMAGKTGLIIGLVHDQFVQVPMEMLESEQKRVLPEGDAWRAVLATTGQPAEFGS